MSVVFNDFELRRFKLLDENVHVYNVSNISILILLVIDLYYFCLKLSV